MTRRQIVNFANGLLDVPYLWAGDSPARGFDCSGLILWIFQNLEILPRGDITAQGLYDKLQQQGMIQPLLPGIEWNPKPGDLLFYGHEHIPHIAIFIDDDKAISASGGGSNIRTREDAERAYAKVKIHSPAYRRDLVACGSIDKWVHS